MKALAAALVAILVAIALWMAPLESSSRGAAGLRSDEGAYRMRLCELALSTGESVSALELVRRAPDPLQPGQQPDIAIWRVISPVRESHPATMRAR